MCIIDKLHAHKSSENNSDNSEEIGRKLSVSKTASSYAVVNGSIVNIDAEDNDDNVVAIASADIGFPRSETIAAIGHRPYTGDLEPVRVSRKNSTKRKENKENDDDEEFCKKCGHYSKRQ